MLILVWCSIFGAVQSAVLDPSLYLSPSPPLTPAETDPPTLWSQPRIKRDDLSVVPIEQIRTASIASTYPNTNHVEEHPSTTPQSTYTPRDAEQESMEKSETFWPRLRTIGPHFGIHVPLTFSLTGTYGRYGNGNGGVIGSSYVSVSEDNDSGIFKMYGKSGLAGSSYGSYTGTGTRVYGGGSSSGWSGWGNGKWGHYGKG